jgi:hypothetical protein
VLPRDAIRSAECYQAGIAQLHAGIVAYTDYNNPVLFASVAPKCVRMGLILYSTGAEILQARAWFEKAADYQLRFICEGKQYQFGGKGSIDNYLELYSAAHLVDKSAELIAALKKCTYTDKDDAGGYRWVSRLIDQFCDVLLGQQVETDDTQIAQLQRMDARVAALPILFSEVSKRSDAAGPALEKYLATHWGPALEKIGKKELKAPKPEYAGKWCLLAAAMCKQLGRTPTLSDKAMRYLPADLLGGSALLALRGKLKFDLDLEKSRQ